MKALELLGARVRWGMEQGDEPLWPNGPTASQYVEGLPRPTGSYVKCVNNLEDLRLFFQYIDAHCQLTKLSTADVPPGCFKEGHEYYTATLPPGWQAFQCVQLLGNLPDDRLDQVRVRRGKHGLELVCPMNETPVSVLVFIADKDGLVTWYPGQLTPACDLRYATVKQIR